jgi:glycosyltransferase involved in cell wall biosynthesis
MPQASASQARARSQRPVDTSQLARTVLACPIVGAVGGISQLIEHGKTGFLVKPGDPSALGELLDPLIGDRPLPIEIGRAARAACEKQLNRRRQISEIVRLIEADCRANKPITGKLACEL